MTSAPALLTIFWIFLRLGLTSFGGPIAHLAYFRAEFVGKRRWLNDGSFGELVSLCQLLPGPASSQVGFSIGLMQRGIGGGIAAFLGFTLPSALVMLALASGSAWLSTASGRRFSHLMELIAAAVISQAIWSMGQRLVFDRITFSLALLSAVAASLFHFQATQLTIVVCAGIAGIFLLKQVPFGENQAPVRSVSRTVALIAACCFAILLAASFAPGSLLGPLRLPLQAFYRSGALVFGGGHVVLPFLENYLVAPGWMDNQTFLTGYGAAQALPGPLFAVSAYLGYAMHASPNGIGGGLLALLFEFLPGLLLVTAALPLASDVRRYTSAAAALSGASAAVVGLLLAALYNPIWLTAVRAPAEFALAIGAFLLMQVWRVPAFVLVFCSALFVVL